MAQQELNSLNDLFIMELKDMLDAEYQITEALPKMIEAASSSQLKQSFERHLNTTKQQINRLNQVFSILGIQPTREHCEGMAGIIKDGQKLLMVKGDPATKDAGLIAAAQKVEHYEISSYGTLRTFANMLGQHDAAKLLQTTLKEESDTDELLTRIAEQSINKRAA